MPITIFSSPKWVIFFWRLLFMIWAQSVTINWTCGRNNGGVIPGEKLKKVPRIIWSPFMKKKQSSKVGENRFTINTFSLLFSFLRVGGNVCFALFFMLSVNMFVLWCAFARRDPHSHKLTKLPPFCRRHREQNKWFSTSTAPANENTNFHSVFHDELKKTQWAFR